MTSSARRRLLLTAYPPDGGVARHVVDIVDGLDPAEWEIDVACLPQSPLERDLRRVGRARLHLLGGRHGRPHLADARDLPLLLGLVREADVVHAHSSKAGFLTRLAAALLGRRDRVVFTPHAWSFWAAGGVERRVYLALERLAARWCKAIVAVSTFEREAGLAAGVGRADQYRVVLNGIDLRPFSRPRVPDPSRVLFVGRLAPPKRHDLALRALAELVQARPEARLDLVGDGPSRPRVEAEIAERGLEGAVRLLGARDDVPHLLSTASCLLLASDYEGCPLSVLEAMAAGVPVVASRVGGLPEVVSDGETGILVEPGRSDALARALEAILADPTRALALGAAGRARAEAAFSRERMIAELTELYRWVASASGRNPARGARL